MAHLIRGHRWDDGKVHYKYGETVWDADKLREWIEEVMKEIAGYCAVTFHYRKRARHYILFRVRGWRGHSSDIGCEGSFVGIGGRQEINLPRDWESRGKSSMKGTIRHEILHALGFFHEQQRRDRDDTVDVLTENMSRTEYGRNFAIERASKSKHHGHYDLDSVMHYSSGSRDSESRWLPYAWSHVASLTTSSDKVLVRYGNLTGLLETRRLVAGSVADSLGLKAVTPLEFDSMVPYTVDTATGQHQFVFLMSSTSGRARVYRMHADGTLGAMTYEKRWTTGWTSAAAVSTAGGTYLAIVKWSTGELHLHRLWHSGTISAIIDSHDWTDAYTHLVFATVQNSAGEQRHYLLLHKSRNGHINIHRMYTDGTLSARKHHYNWTSSWSTLTSWSSGGATPSTFVLLLKSSSGRIRVHEVNWDGSLSDHVESTNWTGGYTGACVFERGPTTRGLLLHKAASGIVKVHEVMSTGAIGDAIDPLWIVENDGTQIARNNTLSRGDRDALRHRYGDP